MAQDLIVYDDDPAIVTFVERVAGEHEFNVHPATTSDDFWQIVDKIQDGALILDLELDQTTGIAILKDLAERRFAAPSLLISGYHNDILRGAERLATKDGLDVRGSMQKPFNIADLVERLEDLR